MTTYDENDFINVLLLNKVYSFVIISSYEFFID